MAMADMNTTKASPGSRFNPFPSIHSYVSAPSMSGMRPETFTSSASGIPPNASVSPTLERRTQDRGFPALSPSNSDPMYVGAQSRGQASIRFRKLPRSFDISILRNILAFSDPTDCYFVTTEDGCADAVATFDTMTQARDAQQRLNGKALPENGAKMVVDVVNDDDSLGSRRNTIDGANGRNQPSLAIAGVSSTSTATNNTSLGRQNPRYGLQAPPLMSPGSANGATLHSIFSPTSPVANGNSLNSLRHESLGDDETSQLLSETHPHGRNGTYSSSHHATDHGLASSFGGLSVQTNLPRGISNGHNGVIMSPGSSVMSPPDSGMGPSRSYSHIQSQSTMNSPGSMTNNPANGNWTFTRPRQSMPPANPADQNPPCNTLYVGNLPPDTCEDELKALFSRQRGYKRLCFRTKHNGPMCFVEFDDINYAAQSLDNLYGTMLTTSVKGGIRLSFSKNPLGVRQGAPSGPHSPLSALGHGPGNGNGAGTPFATANGPPPGLPSPYPFGVQGNQSNTHSSSGSSSNSDSNTIPGRGFFNGNMPSTNNSASLPYAPGGFHHQSLNGGFGGVNGRQQMLRTSGNTSYRPMLNGA